MKKICCLLIFTILFFTLKSLGGNHVSVSTGNKIASGTFLFPADTAKKITDKDSTEESDDTVRSFAFGLNYGSDQSYHGIHSNGKLPYAQPNFTYTAPKGFYVVASVQDILAKKAGGFDALDINPGWNIDLADYTTLNFNLSHYVFRAGTPATIRSGLSDAIETYIDQWIGETEGTFTIEYDYYKKTAKGSRTPGDIILTPDISHTFKFTLNKKSSISLIPEGSFDFGTRNAYTNYQINSGDTIQTKQSKKDSVPANTSFGTLDYNFVFTIDYKVGRFDIEPAFNYTASLYSAPDVSTKPVGYLTLALTYTIEKKVGLSSHPKSKP